MLIKAVELTQLARYPFLKEAREWVKEEGVQLGDILSDPLYERARMRGIERVVQAYRFGIIRQAPLVNDADCIMELYSYPVARMIVSAVESDYLVRRYALSEAKKMYQTLKKEPPEFIETMAREMGLSLSTGVVHFTEYLRCAPTWHTKWKLVNRNVRNGFVTLDASECARLIQETVFAKIADELFSLAPPPDVLRLFRDDIMDLKKRLATREKRTNIGEVKEENYPPCISRLVAAARSGVNIPHVGRFTLVTFLNSIGMKTDDILAVFAGSPDFNKEKTRYQVEHITGRASSTTYKTPRCDTILTWGLCFPDDLCKTVRHPLAYYVRRGRK